MRGVLFLLLGFSSVILADHETPPNQVYNANSQLTVENINKVVEILRDPTAMSSNFRSALGRLPGNIDTPIVERNVDENGELLLPDIEMVGKVISKDRPSTVVFKANEKYYHFEEGESLTKVVNHKVMTFKVLEISKSQVRVLVMPFNKILIF